MIYFVIIAVVGGLFAGGYSYFNYTQNEIGRLKENAARLEISVDLQTATIETLDRDQKIFNELNAELTKRLQETTESKDALIAKLQRHDLTRLSAKKPGLIERRINNATKKAFADIESITRGDASK